MDIRLYRAFGTYRTASRACNFPSLLVILTVLVPVTSQVELSTILIVHSSFATKELTYPYWNIPESHYQNQISDLYLEKYCLQRRKPLILQCHYHSLLRLLPQLAPSSTTLADVCSPSSDLFDKSDTSSMTYTVLFFSSFTSHDHQTRSFLHNLIWSFSDLIRKKS